MSLHFTWLSLIVAVACQLRMTIGQPCSYQLFMVQPLVSCWSSPPSKSQAACATLVQNFGSDSVSNSDKLTNLSPLAATSVCLSAVSCSQILVEYCSIGFFFSATSTDQPTEFYQLTSSDTLTNCYYSTTTTSFTIMITSSSASSCQLLSSIYSNISTTIPTTTTTTSTAISTTSAITKTTTTITSTKTPTSTTTPTTSTTTTTTTATTPTTSTITTATTPTTSTITTATTPTTSTTTTATTPTTSTTTTTTATPSTSTSTTTTPITPTTFITAPISSTTTASPSTSTAATTTTTTSTTTTTTNSMAPESSSTTSTSTAAVTSTISATSDGISTAYASTSTSTSTLTPNNDASTSTQSGTTSTLSVSNQTVALNQALDALTASTHLNTSAKITLSQNVVQSASNMVNSNDTTTQRDKILSALETVTDVLTSALATNVTNTTDSITISTKEITVAAAVVPPAAYQNSAASSSFVSFSANTSPDSDSLSSSVSLSSSYPIGLSTIAIPVSVIAQSAAGSPARLSFWSFASSELFSDTVGSKQFVGSAPISAGILNAASVNNTAQPIVMTYQTSWAYLPAWFNANFNVSQLCSYWNPTLQQWSSSGCWSNLTSNASSGSKFTNATYQCSCNHLTDFALLFNVFEYNDSTETEQFQKELTIASYVGSAVSALCLIITLALSTSIRAVRTHISGQLLISQSVALIGLNVMFILNSALATLVSPGGCIAIAAIQHYFVLASFAWTVMQSAYLYMKLVVVFSVYMPKFTLKVSLVAWCLPLIALIVLFSIQNVYGLYQQQICWITDYLAFIISTLIPVGLILVLNFLAYSFTLHKVIVYTRKQAKRKWLKQSNSTPNSSSIEGQTVRCQIDVSRKPSDGELENYTDALKVLNHNPVYEDSRRGSNESTTQDGLALPTTDAFASVTKTGGRLIVQRQASNAISNVNFVIQSVEAERRAAVLTQLKFGAGLFFLLGLTWVFAFFIVGPSAWLFAILFAIANGLQGLFILAFCCAKGEVKKWIKRHFLMQQSSPKGSGQSSEIAKVAGVTTNGRNNTATASKAKTGNVNTTANAATNNNNNNNNTMTTNTTAIPSTITSSTISPYGTSSGSQTPGSLYQRSTSSTWPDPHVLAPIIHPKPVRSATKLHTLFNAPEDTSSNTRTPSYLKKDSTYSNSTLSTNVSRNTSLSSGQT